jgi:hypothetical protein
MQSFNQYIHIHIIKELLVRQIAIPIILSMNCDNEQTLMFREGYFFVCFCKVGHATHDHLQYICTLYEFLLKIKQNIIEI